MHAAIALPLLLSGEILGERCIAFLHRPIFRGHGHLFLDSLGCRSSCCHRGTPSFCWSLLGTHFKL